MVLYTATLIDLFTEKQFRGVIRTQSNVCNRAFFAKIKKWAPSKIFDGALNTPLQLSKMFQKMTVSKFFTKLPMKQPWSQKLQLY